MATPREHYAPVENISGFQVASGGGATNHLHIHFWGELSKEQLDTAKTLLSLLNLKGAACNITPEKLEKVKEALKGV